MPRPRSLAGVLPLLLALHGCRAPSAPHADATLHDTARPLDTPPEGPRPLDVPPEPPVRLDVTGPTDAPSPGLRVLVFTRTTGFRHESIPAALRALYEIARERAWSLTATEDPAVFAPPTLSSFRVVVFALTSGNVLDALQRRALEDFVRAGGGFAGIHSASDTEYDNPWFGELVGARFARHPPGTPAGTLLVRDPAHPAVTHLPPRWTRRDEWYSFRAPPAARNTLHVLLALDEDSVPLAPEYRMGDHPIAWYQHVHGGRSFHTALGHTAASYDEPAFRAHLAEGIAWAAGGASPRLVLDEFNGTTTPGPWGIHQYDGRFEYELTRDALRMIDRNHGNQHLTRQGLSLDPRRRYSVDALFTLHRHGRGGFETPINSFCINFNVQGPPGREDELEHLYTHAINLDLSSAVPGRGTMKVMGFVDGRFHAVGERGTTCCRFDHEYRLAVAVNTTAEGALQPGRATVTLTDGPAVLERFEADWSPFPWQPDRGRPVRIGVNTHDADWTLRDLRVRYLD